MCVILLFSSIQSQCIRRDSSSSILLVVMFIFRNIGKMYTLIQYPHPLFFVSSSPEPCRAMLCAVRYKCGGFGEGVPMCTHTLTVSYRIRQSIVLAVYFAYQARCIYTVHATL